MNEYNLDQGIYTYIEDIVAAVKEIDYVQAPEIAPVLNADQEIGDTFGSCMLRTKLGVLLLYAGKNKPTAHIIQTGLLKCLVAEGYSNMQIHNDFKIYSQPFVRNKKNVAELAHYLTHRVDPKKYF